MYPLVNQFWANNTGANCRPYFRYSQKIPLSMEIIKSPLGSASFDPIFSSSCILAKIPINFVYLLWKTKFNTNQIFQKKVYSSLQIQTRGKTFWPRMAERLQAWKLRKRYLAVSTSDSVLCQSSLGQSQALFSIQPKNPLMKMIKSPLTQPYLRKKIQKFYFNANQICKVSI